VLASLREGRSGISLRRGLREARLPLPGARRAQIDAEALVDRRAMRFHGGGTAWNHVAMDQAIAMPASRRATSPTSAPASSWARAAPRRGSSSRRPTSRGQGAQARRPLRRAQGDVSTASATLATWFKIKGVNYSISSACATSNHCIGNALRMIQWGKQDVIFAGGCEDLDWSLSCLFDAMGAMSIKYNDTPATASRAYDANRDGFVIAGGAGVLVLEELEHAKARGAKIYAEIVGYGATSDGYDMVAPSGEGAVRCMRRRWRT
jgi:3-oxoacyl-[acyl-carrier-protein] synthase I